jgi:hypothetical protein
VVGCGPVQKLWLWCDEYRAGESHSPLRVQLLKRSTALCCNVGCERENDDAWDDCRQERQVPTYIRGAFIDPCCVTSPSGATSFGLGHVKWWMLHSRTCIK